MELVRFAVRRRGGRLTDFVATCNRPRNGKRFATLKDPHASSKEACAFSWQLSSALHLDSAVCLQHIAVMVRRADPLMSLPGMRLLLYTLAGSGGVMAYLPLLTMLLPMKVDAMAGNARLGVLATCAILGAIAASAANVAFGWLGDRMAARGGGRRGLLAGGMIATVAAYAAIGVVQTAVAIVVAVVVVQIAVNALLAPIGALMAEEVPDAQKGVATALQTLGAPIALLVSALLVDTNLSETGRLGIVALLAVAGVLPLVITTAVPVISPSLSPPVRTGRRRDLAVAWAARLLMQIATVGVSLYLLYYFKALAGGDPAMPSRVARLLVVCTVAPVPFAILLGRWSDAIGRRKPFLLGATALAVAGLVAMAWAERPMVAAVAYGAFASGSAIFLALNTGFAMQLLPDPARRGRDLGLLNLANTIPSLIAPMLTWWLASASDFGAMMLVLAAVAGASGLLTLAIQGSR